ncbi:hypothetical protein AVEN_81362-1 [Araneus ventricosus]|uniref:Uncharacterized protein n=1 Tax=Araneus ventricosus TaxID=182803 RepID=A0A4Y2B8M4_ARAVE|nr:hypothetical protein AVEN_81362-1 [Araneus ventricosus]
MLENLHGPFELRMGRIPPLSIHLLWFEHISYYSSHRSAPYFVNPDGGHYTNEHFQTLFRAKTEQKENNSSSPHRNEVWAPFFFLSSISSQQRVSKNIFSSSEGISPLSTSWPCVIKKTKPDWLHLLPGAILE